ncbi:MAG: 30S ribosome-binding factor RbfA [Cetobacterium sp.]|uniref:Ribosome-binding factor A n=1 Tax=Cetobacterium ceti TaxID=180163 RepID=A0A1T4JTY0_9FUSO|nr:30S ribosome-binding factor RbfA [Cetobacterium ceti]MCJ8342288.1 30S ribosome-binding factor RbfA [Cetobacterium sp.]SJZ33574.1 ribosome-binding factor A [Cetobacterium ceti]
MRRQRLAAIEKEVSKVVSKCLYEEVKNPKLKKAIISITSVKVTEDLKFADLYFSIMPVTGEKFNRDEVVEGLNEIKKFLRKRVSEELSLRYTPEMRIKIDETIEHAIKISQLLNDLKG